MYIIPLSIYTRLLKNDKYLNETEEEKLIYLCKILRLVFDTQCFINKVEIIPIGIRKDIIGISKAKNCFIIRNISQSNHTISETVHKENYNVKKIFLEYALRFTSFNFVITGHSSFSRNFRLHNTIILRISMLSLFGGSL